MKVICDVCGTTFSETETNCPICGCAAPQPAQAVSDDAVASTQENTTAASYARGGRFSKSNVKRSSQSRTSESRYSSDRNRKNESEQGSKGLIAVVIILLLAIIMVVVYIGVNVFLRTGDNLDNTGNNNQDVPQSSTVINGQDIPCVSFTLNSKMIVFEKENEQYTLSAVLISPENTTDTMVYSSSDPEVATVDSVGNVRPGTKQGTAIITVTCGTVTNECTVISSVGEEPPASSGPAGPEVNLPDGFVLKLVTYKDSGEITIAGDATASIYTEIMGVKASEITWTSSDPTIATVENGKVMGIGKGYCYITASIGDQTATCKVICTSNATPPSDYKISHVDVTIAVGETFNLYLMNKETGANVQGIEWQVSQDGIVSISGNKITGQSVAWSGVQVYVEYEGVKYSCRIIVKPAE